MLAGCEAPLSAALPRRYCVTVTYVTRVLFRLFFHARQRGSGVELAGDAPTKTSKLIQWTAPNFCTPLFLCQDGQEDEDVVVHNAPFQM